MAIKPILFNTEMVRAILDGRKTQMRMAIKPVALGLEYEDGSPARLPPYQPEDVLWVRESFSIWQTGQIPDLRRNYLYKADFQGDPSKVVWRPSIHMPKEAARLFLRVTGVGVERLRDMTIKDVMCELGECEIVTDINENSTYKKFPPKKLTSTEPIPELRSLERYGIALLMKEVWNTTIKSADRDKYGWDANPWVWKIEFERCEKPEEWPQ